MEQKELSSVSGAYLTRAHTEDVRIELTDDFLLPEHLDDAKRVIRCEGTLRPGGRYISGKEVEYEGEMVYSVLYITDSNSIKNVIFKAKYAKSIQIPEGAEQDFSVYPEASGVECKLVNPRKMNLRCKIALNFTCMKKEDCSPAFSGDSAEEDSASCEKRYQATEYLRCMTLSKQDQRVSRDIELESGAKPIKEVISCCVELTEDEITVRNGGAECSINGLFRCVYLVKNDEDVQYASAEKAFSLDCLLDAPELEEEFEGNIRCYMKELSVSVARNDSGENRLLEIDFTYDVCGRFFANASCYPVTDLYSCDYECTLEYIEMKTECYVGALSAVTPFSSSVDAPHVSALLAPSATVCIKQVKRDDAEGILYADADVTVSAALRGEDGRISALTTDLPVRIRFPHCESAQQYKAQARIHKIEIRLSGDSVEISGTLNAQAQIFDTETCRIVTAATVHHDRVREDTSGLPITFYYPEDGEALWEIAKKYGSTEEIIRNANEITDDKKIGKSVLLIPCKRKKPLFSKVISK